VALEIDERRADAVRALALRYHWSRVRCMMTCSGRPRFLLAGNRRGGGT